MNDARDDARGRTAWVALAIVAWLAASAWARPLLLPDEGRYVGVAWEMLRSGDWLTPTLDGLPYFHKPPLFYWITAASLRLFGPHEWAARAAPIAGAALGAFALYRFAARWGDLRSARLALVALLAQPLFFVGGQFANLDMLVAGCITAAIVLFADAALCRERGLPHAAALLAAYAAAALGVLAKGLIGAVIPALVIGCWLLAGRRWRTLLGLVSWRGLALFVALAAPWFVAMQRRFDGFLDYFFVVQHFKRFAAGGFNNAQPFWFYPAVLLLFTLPWWPWLVRAWRLRAGASPLRGLMLAWVAVVVVFFSLPQSKLLGYVLPAVPPLAWLAADGYASLVATTARARRLWWAGTGLAAVIGVGAVVVLALQPLHSTRALAGALAAVRAPAEPVFSVGGYPFDLPFYARLDRPLTVVDDWTDPTAGRRDDWHRELADAGRFAPGARAAATLIAPPALEGAICGAGVGWVVGGVADTARFPFLADLVPTFSQAGQRLWRVDAAALSCDGTPNVVQARR